MFKRRSIIAAFLVVALLAVGVGFAAVSDTLSVGGLLQASKAGAESQFDLDVYFGEPVGTLPNNTTVVLGDDNDRATITVNNSTDLAHTGDTVSVVLPVINNSVYDATLTIDNRGVGDEFEVVYTLYSDEACASELDPDTVTTKATVYLQVQIKLVGDPTELDDGVTITRSLDMIMTATTVDSE